MDLVRDILDKRVLDRNGREVGRVDNIVLELRGDTPPRAVVIEIGPAVLASRVRPILGRWVAAIESAFGIGDGSPDRIPVDDILEITDHIKINSTLGDTKAARVEKSLRASLSRIPGSS